MDKYKQWIINYIDNNPEKKKEICSKSGVTENNYSKFAGEGKGVDTIDFSFIQCLIDYHLKLDDAEKLISLMIEELDINKSYCISLLEYLSISKRTELMLSYANKIVEEKGKQKNIAELYIFDHEISKIRDKKQILAMSYEKYYFTNNDLQRVISLMFKNYVNGDLGLFENVREDTLILESMIDEMKNGFIKKSMEYRKNIGKLAWLISCNEIEEARNIATILIKSQFKNKTRVYHYLAQSYMFEDYNKSMKYLDECEENDFVTMECKTFINNIWNKDHKDFSFLNYEKYYSFRNEKLSYLINKGDIQQAEVLIKSYKLEDMTDIQKGFYYFNFYRLTNNPDYLFDSIDSFSLASHRFYKTLPLNELRKLGYSERVLKSLSL